VRKVLCVAALVAAVCATIPGASLAASPVLQGATFDQTAKVLTVTWSLPAGVESHVLEASMNPALDSEGYFLIGSHHGYHGADIISELPDRTATSWVHAYPDLVPGHYYVHVGAFDTTCSTCPIQWTGVGTFDVNEAPPPPPPPPPAKKVFAPDCAGRPHFKPRSIIVACGDGNLQLLKLRWAQWTSLRAEGTGVYYWNDCIPACYKGHFHRRAGACVKLYRVTRCKSKGFLQFTRISVTPPASLRRFRPFTQRLSCTFR